MSASIFHEVPIRAKADQVFEMLTEEDKLSSWWLPGSKMKSEVGAVGTFPLSNGENCIQLRVAELLPNKKVAWDCLEHKFAEWSDTRIEFEIVDDAEGVLLRFRHSGWKDSSGVFGKTSFYWASLYLMNLKSLLEKG